MRRQVDKAMEYRSIIYCKEGSDYYYFHYNHKGDVISVTDADKEEVAYYEYDAWRNTTSEAGASGAACNAF